MSPDKQSLDDLRIDRGHAPRRRLSTGLILLVLLVVAVTAAIIWWFTRPKVPTVRTVVVREAAAGPGGERTLLNGSGYVTARREATVSSKITGRVVEVLVEEGMKVEQGQVLARLDASNVQKSLELAEAQLKSAQKQLHETQANLDQAERELKRMTQLASEKVASASELDRVDAEAKSLRARLSRQEADVAVAEREVGLWKQQIDDTIIRAPFTGIVTSKNAQPGEMISPMSAGGFTRTGICTIVDMSSLEIEVEVNESYINRVQPNAPVEARLDSYPDWKIPAKVIAIIPTANRQNATVKVRVGFDKLDPRILPEMSVKVAFQSSGSEAAPVRGGITIPKAAVRQREGRDMVWVVREGRVERRAITVADTLGNDVSVAAGLSGGERIAIEGTDQLVDGGRVKEAK
jgi:RND family efflux transporter MFP subunit